MVAVPVGQRSAVTGEDRLTAEHEPLGPGGGGVVVDDHGAQHGLRLLGALSEVRLTTDEVRRLDLRALHARLDDRPLAVELVAEGPVALLDAAGRGVDPDADGAGAGGGPGPQQPLPPARGVTPGDLDVPAAGAYVGD